MWQIRTNAICNADEQRMNANKCVHEMYNYVVLHTIAFLRHMVILVTLLLSKPGSLCSLAVCALCNAQITLSLLLNVRTDHASHMHACLLEKRTSETHHRSCVFVADKRLIHACMLSTLLYALMMDDGCAHASEIAHVCVNACCVFCEETQGDNGPSTLRRMQEASEATTSTSSLQRWQRMEV